MSLARTFFFSVSVLVAISFSNAALALDYAVEDSRLEIVKLDSAETESFLSVCADTAGRLFVGARESLFRYDPDGKGGFQPRFELYRFPPHSWVYDVEVRGHDVYALTTTALYILRGAVTAKAEVAPRRLVWGIPLGHVHQCFHALAWGPEGDLYVSTGDPMPLYGDLERPDNWAHWTYFSQPHGTRIPFSGNGCVFRCRPDGTRFQVASHGLRNACGLAFTRDFDLLSNDNDHESAPSEYVPGRLLHTSPHAHFLWPRGWMLEKQPGRLDILDTIFPGMKRAVPVHMAYYDEAFLPQEYRNNLLVARWGIRAVTRYALRRDGATIKSDEEKTLLTGRNLARPLGVCVGPRGRVFVTICYMAHNEGSPVYRSDVVMVTRADARAGADNPLFDVPAVSAGFLWAELSTDSWGRRHRAHTELQRRGGALLDDALRRLAEADPKDPAYIHLLWLAASSGTRRSTETLKTLATHDDADVRTQAVRALAEFDGPRGVFTRALADSEPRVRHAATVAFYRLEGPVPEDLVTRSAVSEEAHIRQAATMLLAKRSSVSEFQRLCASKDRAIRMAGVLAAGFRLTMPPVHEPLDPALPLNAYQGGDTPYVIPYADATIDLRKFGPAGMFRIADHWKVRQREKWEEDLFALLVRMLEDSDEPVRLHAANFLAPLRDARSDPAVETVRRVSQEARLAGAPIGGVTSVWLAGPFADQGKGFDQVHAPEHGPVDLGSTYEDGDRALSWEQLHRSSFVDLIEAVGSMDDASVYGFFRLETFRRQRVFLLVGSDDGIKVWQNGELVHEVREERGALPFQDVVSLELQAGSNDMLVRVQNHTGASAMYMHYRALDKIAVTLPAKVSLAALAERLRGGADGDVEVDPAFFEKDWNVAIKQGKKEEGRKLYESLACARCHAVRAGVPTTGGPSLVDAKKRFTIPYLVESVLLPNKTVSPVFRGTLIVTAEGDVHEGLVLGETADAVDFLLRDGMRRKIPTNTIMERRMLETSPMPSGLVKRPEDLANLLAYLMSDAQEGD